MLKIVLLGLAVVVAFSGAIYLFIQAQKDEDNEYFSVPEEHSKEKKEKRGFFGRKKDPKDHGKHG